MSKFTQDKSIASIEKQIALEYWDGAFPPPNMTCLAVCVLLKDHDGPCSFPCSHRDAS